MLVPTLIDGRPASSGETLYLRTEVNASSGRKVTRSLLWRSLMCLHTVRRAAQRVFGQRAKACRILIEAAFLPVTKLSRRSRELAFERPHLFKFLCHVAQKRCDAH